MQSGQTPLSLAAMVRQRARQLALPLHLLRAVAVAAASGRRGRLMAMRWTRVLMLRRLGRAAAPTPAAQQARGLRAAVAASAASAPAPLLRLAGARVAPRLQADDHRTGAAAAAGVPVPPAPLPRPPPEPSRQVQQTDKLLARVRMAALQALSTMRRTRQQPAARRLVWAQQLQLRM